MGDLSVPYRHRSRTAALAVMSRRRESSASLPSQNTGLRPRAVFATSTHVFNNKYCFHVARRTLAAYVSGLDVVINNNIVFTRLGLARRFFFYWRRILFKRKTSVSSRSPRFVSIIFINTLYIFFRFALASVRILLSDIEKTL